ncbi:MAG: hypothetical protein V1834_01540 [Candidatus Micrarchaeota archaeon]
MKVLQLGIPNPYEWKNYRFLVLVPLLLMAASLFFIPQIPQGIDLKGGLLFTVYAQDDFQITEVKQAIAAEFGPNAEVRAFESPAGKGFEVELPLDEDLTQAEAALIELHEFDRQLVQAEVNASFYNDSGAVEVTELRFKVLNKANEVLGLSGQGLYAGEETAEAVALAETAFSDAKDGYRKKLVSVVSSIVTVKSSTFKEIGSSLSKFFFNKIQEVVLWAFIVSGALIFLVFRQLVPSFAVIFGAVADIVITMGVMGLLGIPLSLASVAALLMLIGFSLDTDVMLTTRVIRHKEGSPRERAFNAMKTGFTMNCTTVAAFGVLTVLASMLQIGIYYQIGVVAVIGGVVDFIATWCGNAPIILWFAEREQKGSS